MRASLDTNVIIHLYQANREQILFDFFEDGVFIYEQIRNVELQNHGQSVIERIDRDISSGKIKVYTRQILKEQGVLLVFEEHVCDTKNAYAPGDMGEVYAIALAQTLGTYALVTDDIKQGGPYMSLLQFVDYDVMPLTFADLLLLRFLEGKETAKDTISIFGSINEASSLNWSFTSQLGKFIRRFWIEPYQEADKKWMVMLCEHNEINFKEKIKELRKLINN